MSTAVTPIQNHPSVLATMADRYGMAPAAFEATVRATCMPGASVSREQFAAFLLVAKEYGLNPLTKEVYAFPSRGGIQPIVSIDGWANLCNSHPQMDGIEFEDQTDGEGKLAAVTCRIFRKDRSRPTVVTEYMAECRRDTDVWKKWPARMLRHKALIQCARYAFGFSGIVDPDEADRIREAETMQPTGLRARLAASRAQATEGFSAAHSEPVEAELVLVDTETGELIDAAHAAQIEQELAVDEGSIGDEFGDASPADPSAPAAIIADLEEAIVEALSKEDATIAVQLVRDRMANRLNTLKGEDRSKARAMIADATKRAAGEP
jgi:phage recombination protein Bet